MGVPEVDGSKYTSLRYCEQCERRTRHIKLPSDKLPICVRCGKPNAKHVHEE